MRSCNEMLDIYSNIKSSKDGILNVLTNEKSREYISKEIDDNLLKLEQDLEKQVKLKSELEGKCSDPKFIELLFSNKGVLDWISSKYTCFPISFEDIKTLYDDKNQCSISKRRNVEKESDNEVLSQSNSVGFTGQIPSDDFSSLIGRSVFNIDSTLNNKSLRQPTKSDVYVVIWSNNYNTYKIMLKDENEVNNVFTLYDYFSKRVFRHKDGRLDTLATLGVNIVSLKGFPKYDGTICDDREITDYIVQTNNVMRAVVLENLPNSKFVYDSVLLTSVMKIFKSLGYGYLLYRYFYKVVDTAKKEPNNSIFKSFEVKSIKGKNYISGYNEVIRDGGFGIFYPSASNVKGKLVNRVKVFELIMESLKVICTYHKDNGRDIDLNELLKLVKFYGGHDFVAQGDDLNDYVNDEVSLPNDLGNSSLNFISYSECKDSCSASHKPTVLKFSYSGTTYIIHAKDLDRVGRAKKSGFSSLDALYSIMQILDDNGVSIEDICMRVNKGVLKTEYISDEPYTRTNSHVTLSDGRYFYANICQGWNNFSTSVEDIFDLLSLDLSDLELCFDKDV